MPAIWIIIYSGSQFRDEMIINAHNESARLTERIVSEQQALVVSAEQLMAALAMLPDVQNRETTKVEPVLRKLKNLNHMYSNIFIADLKGTVWATAVPVPPPFVVADRRYFKNALATGRLSSGEYIISRANTKQIISLSYPIKDKHGSVTGVISIGILLNEYQKHLKQMAMPAGTSFLFLDYKGVILYRAINTETSVGKPYPPDEFRKILEGPETLTTIKTGMVGYKIIATYRKLFLPGEQSPYMYISAGLPLDSVTETANRALLLNTIFYLSILGFTIALSALVGKRVIADRVGLLDQASRQVAAGDFKIRIAEKIQGGELGNLGQSFDSMTEQLAQREAERLNAEKERLDFERQLQHAQKLESLGILTGGIAHDFNNILAVIIGHCDLAILRPEKVENHIPPIRSAAERAAGLCRQMLAYSGRASFVVTKIDMEVLVDEIISMLKVTTPQNISIISEFAVHTPIIEADDTEIRQVVMNLIINSVEAIGEQHGEIRTSLSNVEIRDIGSEKDCLGNNIPLNKYVCLEVTDNGCGMTEETKIRIFEPFYTTKFSGRGLGLSATNGIITAHGGALQLFSRPGLGTTFKVYLPAHVEETANGADAQGVPAKQSA